MSPLSISGILKKRLSAIVKPNDRGHFSSPFLSLKLRELLRCCLACPKALISPSTSACSSMDVGHVRHCTVCKGRMCNMLSCGIVRL